MEKKNYGDSEKLNGCSELGGEEEMNRHSTEDFWDNETILCGTIVVDTCHYKYV